MANNKAKRQCNFRETHVSSGRETARHVETHAQTAQTSPRAAGDRTCQQSPDAGDCSGECCARSPDHPNNHPVEVDLRASGVAEPRRAHCVFIVPPDACGSCAISGNRPGELQKTHRSPSIGVHRTTARPEPQITNTVRQTHERPVSKLTRRKLPTATVVVTRAPFQC